MVCATDLGGACRCQFHISLPGHTHSTYVFKPACGSSVPAYLPVNLWLTCANLPAWPQAALLTFLQRGPTASAMEVEPSVASSDLGTPLGVVLGAEGAVEAGVGSALGSTQGQVGMDVSPQPSRDTCVGGAAHTAHAARVTTVHKAQRRAMSGAHPPAVLPPLSLRTACAGLPGMVHNAVVEQCAEQAGGSSQLSATELLCSGGRDVMEHTSQDSC